MINNATSTTDSATERIELGDLSIDMNTGEIFLRGELHERFASWPTARQVAFLTVVPESLDTVLADLIEDGRADVAGHVATAIMRMREAEAALIAAPRPAKAC